MLAETLEEANAIMAARVGNNILNSTRSQSKTDKGKKRCGSYREWFIIREVIEAMIYMQTFDLNSCMSCPVRTGEPYSRHHEPHQASR